MQEGQNEQPLTKTTTSVPLEISLRVVATNLIVHRNIQPKYLPSHSRMKTKAQ